MLIRLLAFLLVALAAPAQTLITEPDQTFTPIYDFIDSATSTLDMTMYEFVDLTAQQHLAALAARGVTVRVILDQNLEKASNLAAYTFLNSNGCHAVWANPTYQATHQKTITVDSARSLILTANLTSRYYPSTRDFALLDPLPADVAEIEAVFNADFRSAAVTPLPAQSLLWSPTNSSSALLALIASATHTLVVESEEISDPAIVTALSKRARAGVAVSLIMTNTADTYATQFKALTRAGVKVYTYASTAPLYIHAKILIVDTSNAFVGSENFSVDSLTLNRELGATTRSLAVLTALTQALIADRTGATLWTRTR